MSQARARRYIKLYQVSSSSQLVRLLREHGATNEEIRIVLQRLLETARDQRTKRALGKLLQTL